ncbi:hypothetical protein CEXT_774351 [Caerostris extrusa]|uniref:Uncharacterized protein n=1 Tax=Caerostris extrusa TaxID=172846 RepID=A0AAV4X1I9_CAEEX|nr:hypothetical protein CEXT_774351 [Caerostris extrusa]
MIENCELTRPDIDVPASDNPDRVGGRASVGGRVDILSEVFRSERGENEGCIGSYLQKFRYFLHRGPILPNPGHGGKRNATCCTCHHGTGGVVELDFSWRFDSEPWSNRVAFASCNCNE